MAVVFEKFKINRLIHSVDGDFLLMCMEWCNLGDYQYIYIINIYILLLLKIEPVIMTILLWHL